MIRGPIKITLPRSSSEHAVKTVVERPGIGSFCGGSRAAEVPSLCTQVLDLKGRGSLSACHQPVSTQPRYCMPCQLSQWLHCSSFSLRSNLLIWCGWGVEAQQAFCGYLEPLQS